jgi:hypothetical protein
VVTTASSGTPDREAGRHGTTGTASRPSSPDETAHARAVGLYGGPFLDGVHIEGSVRFERWVEGATGQADLGQVLVACNET